MGRFGLARSRVQVTIAGGARMFKTASVDRLGNIGERNTEAVRRQLQKNGFRIRSADVGGTTARTMSLELATGKVGIKSIGNTFRYI